MASELAATRWTGPELRAQRVKRSLRAEDIARAIGVSRRTISSLEAHAVASPRDVDRYFIGISRLERIASESSGKRESRGIFNSAALAHSEVRRADVEPHRV